MSKVSCSQVTSASQYVLERCLELSSALFTSQLGRTSITFATFRPSHIQWRHWIGFSKLIITQSTKIFTHEGVQFMNYLQKSMLSFTSVAGIVFHNCKSSSGCFNPTCPLNQIMATFDGSLTLKLSVGDHFAPHIRNCNPPSPVYLPLVYHGYARWTDSLFVDPSTFLDGKPTPISRPKLSKLPRTWDVDFWKWLGV